MKCAQQLLASRVGLSQPQLSRLLNGRFTRETESLRRLCAFLGEKCIYRNPQFSLKQFPQIERCLAELLDGTKPRERVVLGVLKSLKHLR